MVSAQEHNSHVCVSVVDQGIGISDEALPQIFDEYYCAKEGAKFNKSATGLGLAIVKRVVVNLALRLEVVSEVGKGTSFEITIPKADRPKQRRS